jgi:hypothetical protein
MSFERKNIFINSLSQFDSYYQCLEQSKQPSASAVTMPKGDYKFLVKLILMLLIRILSGIQGLWCELDPIITGQYLF